VGECAPQTEHFHTHTGWSGIHANHQIEQTFHANARGHDEVGFWLTAMHIGLTGLARTCPLSCHSVRARSPRARPAGDRRQRRIAAFRRTPVPGRRGIASRLARGSGRCTPPHCPSKHGSMAAVDRDILIRAGGLSGVKQTELDALANTIAETVSDEQVSIGTVAQTDPLGAFLPGSQASICRSAKLSSRLGSASRVPVPTCAWVCMALSSSASREQRHRPEGRH
jgi:hypothetical protein